MLADQVGEVRKSRLEFVDALRGSALGGIMILHATEHWNLMDYPIAHQKWLQMLDRWALYAGFTVFQGKAYAVFALLFGFSFFLILDSWTKRGIPFAGRFLWRLAILGCFGYLHGIIYWSDFLVVIALLGVPLLMLYRLGTRTLAWISAMLLLQVPNLWDEAHVLISSSYHPISIRHSAGFIEPLHQVSCHGSFFDLVRSNLWQGQWARFWWFVDDGRYTQMLGLFLLGYLLGRSRALEVPARRIALAKRALFCSVAGAICVLVVRFSLKRWGALTDLPDEILIWYRNLMFTGVWVAALTLLFETPKSRGVSKFLAPCGRTSLTCYVMQGLIGVPLFYSFGFGLFRYLGPFYSLLVGCVLFVCQCLVARLWLARFAQGPLEWLWRKLTMLDFADFLHSKHDYSRLVPEGLPSEMASSAAEAKIDLIPK